MGPIWPFGVVHCDAGEVVRVVVGGVLGYIIVDLAVLAVLPVPKYNTSN